MPKTRKPPLLSEMARLAVEYPEEEWLALGARLRDRQFIDELAGTVGAVAELAAKVSYKNTTKPTSRQKTLVQVAKKDPRKAKLLLTLKSRLTDKADPPPLSQLRDFAAAVGIKDRLPSRRDQAVNHIIRHLMGKTVEQIAAISQIRLPDRRDLGREYHRWVDLILRPSQAKAPK